MRSIITLLLLSSGLLQQACQKPKEMTDGRPAIKSISFAGIPAQNVFFDAPNATIMVQLPPSLKAGLQPSFELTDETNVISGVAPDNTIDLTPFCSCSNSVREVVLRVANKTGTAVYNLTVMADGPLRAQPSNVQITFSRQTKLLEMSLPVDNLYSNPRITDLIFTNVATGKTSLINADAICLNTCKSTAHNQLMFTIRSPIERQLDPGTYAIALKGGTDRIDFPQHLVVTD